MKNGIYVNHELEEAFQKAFDRVFRVFGETAKENLLLFLKESFSLSRADLAKKPLLLEEGLMEAFRAGGGMLIKRMLLKELYGELQVSGYGDRDWNLPEHLENLRNLLEMRSVALRQLHGGT